VLVIIDKYAKMSHHLQARQDLAMMGQKANGRQLNMFYPGLCLARRVRPDHPLRQVKQLVDFDIIYQEVEPFDGVNGHVSVPPPVILKLMLLLVFYNVRAERELMARQRWWRRIPSTARSRTIWKVMTGA